MTDLGMGIEKIIGETRGDIDGQYAYDLNLLANFYDVVLIRYEQRPELYIAVLH